MYSGCFITGTDTSIGKTFITAALFRAGLMYGGSQKRKVAAFKPVQTGVPANDFSTASEDAVVYLNAAADIESTDGMVKTLYRYSAPCSPHLAASLDSKRIGTEKISTAKITAEIMLLQQSGYFVLVEPAGGLYVPLNENETVLDLIQQAQTQRLRLPVILVFANRIGCINHVLLSLSELRRRNISVLGLISNENENNSPDRKEAGFDPETIRKDNIATIEKFGGVSVITEMPFFGKNDTDTWNEAAKILLPVWEKF
jgi:adenosylmethionine-8-amino-7-oxononanoate aminotransferase